MTLKRRSPKRPASRADLARPYAGSRGKVERILAKSRPWRPPQPAPPPGAPNVIVMLVDDMGFSDLGCFGGEIDTPNLDRLAAGGVRFVNFRVTPMCSPTRASLMTGLNPHNAGVGEVGENVGRASACTTTSTSSTRSSGCAICACRRSCPSASSAIATAIAGWQPSCGRQGIPFTSMDNAFVEIADLRRAQALADAFPVPRLHERLDALAAEYCPVIQQFGSYHWSIMQVEYATDLMFRGPEDLRPLYDTLVRTAIHAVKPDHVATFLGRKLTGNYAQELGNDFHARVEGTRLKHHMGPVAIKLYDKQARVLRIETTANDVSFFRHHRTVGHRDGRRPETKLAPVQKTIYSLPVVRGLLRAANERYLAYLSELTDPSAGVHKAERLAAPVARDGRRSPGFNLFATQDLNLFQTLARGEWAISGLQNNWLRRHLGGLTGPQVSRLLRRLRDHGVVKKVGRTYRYHLTPLGRLIDLTALKLRELVVIPSLAGLLPQPSVS